MLSFNHLVSNRISSEDVLKYTPSFYWFSQTDLNWYINEVQENGYDENEGIYEFDKFRCFLKNYQGKLYLINLTDTGYPCWPGYGEVKAILSPTAAPDVFTCLYWDNYRVEQSCRAAIGLGFLKIFHENGNSDTYLKTWPTDNISSKNQIETWSGTGFALKDGYVVTNYHVIENAKNITIQGIKGDFNTVYNAEIIGVDRNNDLALLKISDSSFNGFGIIPYSISSTTVDVGEDIYVLGYPLISTMGDEIKLTNGIISSKTGYQGDVALYQISAPIQPGNSGGPLFDKKGNVIGIVSSKHSGAENVGYAIKSSYLRNLVESCVSTTILPTSNTVSNLPLTGKVKTEKNFVFYIHCSSR